MPLSEEQRGIIRAQSLWSMPDAAGQLAITSKHLYTLAGRGEISTVKLGKRRLVPADEIVRFLEQLAPA